MYPDLFGLHDFSYIFMIIVGILAAFTLLVFYLKKEKVSRNGILDVLICGCFAVMAGVLGGILTQNLYELIKDPSHYQWTWAMTFYGGLFFGAGLFIILFIILTKRDEDLDFKKIFVIAPACITLAHAFGRIGCLMAGCCYGAETTSWLGMPCASIDDKARIPTQLIEAIFLFLLSGGLTYLAFGIHFKYSMCIYAFTYSIFRFVIEFFRGDERGGTFLNMSPSQIWCIVLFLSVIPLWFLIKNVIFKENNSYEQKETN